MREWTNYPAPSIAMELWVNTVNFDAVRELSVQFPDLAFSYSTAWRGQEDLNFQIVEVLAPNVETYKAVLLAAIPLDLLPPSPAEIRIHGRVRRSLMSTYKAGVEQ